VRLRHRRAALSIRFELGFGSRLPEHCREGSVNVVRAIGIANGTGQGRGRQIARRSRPPPNRLAVELVKTSTVTKRVGAVAGLFSAVIPIGTTEAVGRGHGRARNIRGAVWA